MTRRTGSVTGQTADGGLRVDMIDDHWFIYDSVYE